jgi:hypothetical protein
MANVLHAGTDHPENAEKLLRDVIEVRTQIFGPENGETLKARQLLAQSLYMKHRNPEAEASIAK